MSVGKIDFYVSMVYYGRYHFKYIGCAIPSIMWYIEFRIIIGIMNRFIHRGDDQELGLLWANMRPLYSLSRFGQIIFCK